MYDLLSIMNLEVAVSKSMSRHVDRQCEKVKKGNDAYELKKCMTWSFSTLAPEIYVVFNIETGGGGGPRRTPAPRYLKPGGRESPDRLAGVSYKCTGSFCFNPDRIL